MEKLCCSPGPAVNDVDEDDSKKMGDNSVCWF